MDDRFAHMSSDPRFMTLPKKEKKVKIDKRFSTMFHDKKFKLKYSLDKRGRPVRNSTTEDLKRYYDISSNSDSGDASSDEEESFVKSVTLIDPTVKKKTPKAVKVKIEELNDVTSNNLGSKKKVHFSREVELPSDEETSDDENKDSKNQVDLARGIGNVETSSSEDNDSSEDESSDDDEEEITHGWGELDKEAPQTDNITRRLAICNMDWDRIKAVDLFVLANSFKPAEGNIKSVKIYPSDYGLKRLREEEVKGPIELVQETLKSDDEDYTESNEGSKYHMEKLRKYQLNRLRYYYAIMECDAPETASKLYEELDGMEYESSSSQLDLRFVPDEVSFDHEPTTVCMALPDLSTYQPVLFTTTALQQASVQLTWDETNPDRVRTIQKAFSAADEADADLKTYLASSSEDEGISSVEEMENEKPTSSKPINQNKDKGSGSNINKYKALLAEIEEEEKSSKERDVTLEISWEPGLKGKAESLLKKREKMKDATVFEEYLEKKKEKKKLKKEGKNLNNENKSGESSNEDDEGQAFSDDDLPDDVDLNDPFYKEEMNMDQKVKKKSKKNLNKTSNKEEQESQAELELLMMENEDKANSNKHFNLKNLIEETSKSKMKREKRKNKKMNKIPKPIDEEFEVNVSDPRFTAIYESALYNIDPSDPHYKKTKAMQTFVEEKFKRRSQSVITQVPSKIAKLDESSESNKINPSLNLLVNSVKSKTVNYKNRKVNN